MKVALVEEYDIILKMRMKLTILPRVGGLHVARDQSAIIFWE